VRHFVALGRRKIATITGALNNPDGQARLEGYKVALEELGLPYNPNWVAEGQFNLISGYQAMKTLLRQDIDAVFAASDIMAVGALQALNEAGKRVPDDIAIIGFDDLPTAISVTPQLTTVRQPIQEKGARATTLLLDLIEGKVKGPCQELLPTRLITRQSCGANRHAGLEQIAYEYGAKE
jgi:DNA-binding LacI/PurR family transcriptional regulator